MWGRGYALCERRPDDKCGQIRANACGESAIIARRVVAAPVAHVPRAAPSDPMRDAPIARTRRRMRWAPALRAAPGTATPAPAPATGSPATRPLRFAWTVSLRAHRPPRHDADRQ